MAAWGGMVVKSGTLFPEVALPGLEPETGNPCGTVTRAELIHDGRPLLLVFLRWLG